MIEIQKILVPTDFSDYSQHAVRCAVALAQSFMAKLYVVHIFEHAVVVAPTETFHPEIWVEAEKSEKERLNQVTQGLRTEGIHAEPVFVSSTAYIEIVKTAQRAGCGFDHSRYPRTHRTQPFSRWVNSREDHSTRTLSGAGRKTP
jgi:nucleotide-binding universal stress UspA family protein